MGIIEFCLDNKVTKDEADALGHLLASMRSKQTLKYFNITGVYDKRKLKLPTTQSDNQEQK